jgi:hypothetical protein
LTVQMLMKRMSILLGRCLVLALLPRVFLV